MLSLGIASAEQHRHEADDNTILLGDEVQGPGLSDILLVLVKMVLREHGRPYNTRSLIVSWFGRPNDHENPFKRISDWPCTGAWQRLLIRTASRRLSRSPLALTRLVLPLPLVRAILGSRDPSLRPTLARGNADLTRAWTYRLDLWPAQNFGSSAVTEMSPTTPSKPIQIRTHQR